MCLYCKNINFLAKLRVLVELTIGSQLNNKRKTSAAIPPQSDTGYGFLSRLRENERSIWWTALLTTVTTIAFASIPQSPESPRPAIQDETLTESKSFQQSVIGQIGSEARNPQTLAHLGPPAPDIQEMGPGSKNIRLPTDELRATDIGIKQPVWTKIKIRRGDNLSTLLRHAGVPAPDRRKVLLLRPASFYQLMPGRMLGVQLDENHALAGLRYRINDKETALVIRDENGLRLDKEIWQPEIRIVSAQGIIETSLFEAAQKAGVSDRLIFGLAEIFGWDVDFALDVRRGDKFSVIYEELYRDGIKVRDGNIIAAEFVNQGLAFRAISFADSDGKLGYYTPDGMSVRRAFLRTPVKFSRISSRFTKRRYHPVLKRWRAHQGIDYAAPYGTPVRSTAKGRVVFRGYNGGYGNTVIIKNGGVYSTLYAHLSRFKKRVRIGSHVKQGQIIGYIGKSGLATGSHLHYEFRVNNRHRNPLRYPMPKAHPIPHEHHLKFLTHAKQWIDSLDELSQSIQVAER